MKLLEKPRKNYDQVIKVIPQESNSRRIPLLKSINWLYDQHIQDNGFCQEPLGEITEENWQKSIEKAKQKKAWIFFAHDFEPLKSYEIIKDFEILICPVHSIETIRKYYEYFDWFGFDPRQERSYTINDFMKITEQKKRWSMGWRNVNDHSIVCFDGFDTTIPTTLSRFGKVLMPNGILMDNKKRITTNEIILINMINLDYFARSLWLKYSTNENQLCLRSWFPNFAKEEVI